ncbi:MAG: putative aminopeptidase [Gemmatimonadetes bacterium]|nr:putative aminopeptidase [Gemmatimonadota bacterium]
MNRGFRLAPLLAATVALGASACSPAYVLRAGWEEAKILHRRHPIAQIVADPRTPPERRGKLQLVLDARAYAHDSLGLKVGKSYTLFSEVRSDTLALVLSAARKDRFQGYSWWFPIVGRVPYKGFFREADARREMRKLEARGYDTYLRPTTAFSTLGWFTDPLLSTLLQYDSVELGNTVIHEVTHNTIYVGGQAMFNESLANFVGGRGAIRFFCGREGPQSTHCRRAQDEWADDLVTGAFMSDMVGRLEALYARTDLTPAQKVERREDIFDQAKADYRTRIQPQFRAGTYSGFLTAPLNNATLISRRLYYGRLDLFERVLRSRGGDLPKTIADIVAAAKGSKDPYAAVEALLPPGQGL